MTVIISFTKDANGTIFGYDSDAASQALAQQRLSSGHNQFTPVEPAAADLLAQAQVTRRAAIKAACETAIVGGFTSSALGTEHTYPSADENQRNMLNAALASQGQPDTWTTSLWCMIDGEWVYTPHTAVQAQRVNADWHAYRQAQQQHYADLLGKIDAAASAADVEALTW